MKKIQMHPWTGLILVAAISCTLNACAPLVVVEPTLAFPARSVDSVVVYGPSDTVPEQAIGMGKVSVADPGMSRKVSYEEAVSIAKEKTAKIGGNGLLITTHKKPSFWGSNSHQIVGTMLYISDTELPDSIHEKAIEAGNAARISEGQAMRQRFLSPRNKFLLNAGPSFITSRIETPHGDYTNVSGFEMAAEYQHLFKDKPYGIGIMASYFKATVDGMPFELAYFAPSMVASAKMGRNWSYDIALAIGYAYSNSNKGDKTEHGIGYATKVGLEYLISERVGIGLSTYAHTFRFKKPKGFYLGDREVYGIQNISILAGIRFYL